MIPWKRGVARAGKLVCAVRDLVSAILRQASQRGVVRNAEDAGGAVHGGRHVPALLPRAEGGVGVLLANRAGCAAGQPMKTSTEQDDYERIVKTPAARGRSRFSSETQAKPPAPTKAGQQVAALVGQAFSLPGLLPQDARVYSAPSG
jgi:hypothetical protein